MSDVFRDPEVGWLALLVVLLPLLVIGIGEVEERLRQRDSPLQRPVGLARSWVLPLFAVWSLIRVLFDPDESNLVLRVVGSAFVVSLGAAALAALRIIVDGFRDRPRASGRSVPRLLLAFPRLVLLMVIAWTLVAGVWDVDLSSALAALGVTSLIVSFALQDTLGGIASGFTLLADQPFQPGDWISTGDLEGRVVDINWRSSRIQTRNGDLVVVPNGQLASATITNFDEPTRLHRLVFPVQVAFVNSPTDARQMLLAAARSTPGVLEDPEPYVAVTQVDDPLMGYEVHMWIDDYALAPRVKSEFGSLVWYHSHRRGVPLPSPAQDLFLWDGERSAAGGERSLASLLAGLRTSNLLDELGDEELDRLAEGAHAERFAAGETILTPDDGHVVVIESGRAQLVLRLGSGAQEAIVDLAAGDLVAALDREDTQGYDVVLIAVDDCHVLSLPPDVAGAVISRAPALNMALDQMSLSRRRRVLRMLRRLGLTTDRAASSAALDVDELQTAEAGDSEEVGASDETAAAGETGREPVSASGEEES